MSQKSSEEEEELNFGGVQAATSIRCLSHVTRSSPAIVLRYLVSVFSLLLVSAYEHQGDAITTTNSAASYEYQCLTIWHLVYSDLFVAFGNANQDSSITTKSAMQIGCSTSVPTF